MSHRFPLLVLGALIASGGETRADVIGEDSRRAAGPDEAELTSAVGYVSCSRIVDGRLRFSRGTATVVGNRRTILTAAHVLADEAGRRGPRVEFDVPAECVFRQQDALGQPEAEVAFSRAIVGAYRANAGAPDEDWAVLTTVEPLPATTTPLRFGMLDAADLVAETSVPIAILAFHADLREARRRPLYSEGRLFPVDYAGFRRLAHTADTGRMSSGGAIVRRTADGLRIVIAINRSGANFGDFNLAVPLTGALEAALRSSVDGEVPGLDGRLAALR